MAVIRYKEWLSKTAPEGGGEIWDNRSNSDLGFGRMSGAKSKNVSPDKSGQAELDRRRRRCTPEKLFGVEKAQDDNLDTGNIGGNNYGNNHVSG